jgi:hypothetical protein
MLYSKISIKERMTIEDKKSDSEKFRLEISSLKKLL